MHDLALPGGSVTPSVYQCIGLSVYRCISVSVYRSIGIEM